MITTVPTNSRSISWRTILVLVLAFWLSSSLFLDLVIMPLLYLSGMMADSGFASAGYSIFWVSNRLELLCAAAVLTGVLGLRSLQQTGQQITQVFVWPALALLAIALVYTYALTPQMSVLGLQLNLFTPVSETPALMNQLHMGYWLLEVSKFALGGWLLKQVLSPVID